MAWQRREPELAGTPTVVVDGHGVVRSASPEARHAGIELGVRRRESEARCPGVAVRDTDPSLEARVFETVVSALEAVTPRLWVERPGQVLFGMRGPSRFFGGDVAVAEQVHAALRAVDVAEVRIGIADGAFAARIAARRARTGAGERVVAPGRSVEFLAEQSVRVLGDPELATVLERLGLATLGTFAALPPGAVVARFGATGTRAHELARGFDEPVVSAEPPPELIEATELDPPITDVDAAVFVARGLAGRLLDRLEAAGWSCSRVLIEAETEHGEHLARTWCHDAALTSDALALRVRWQLDAWLTGGGARPADVDLASAGVITGGLTMLRLVPDALFPGIGRQLGFWGGDAAADDRAGRVLTRLQDQLGPEAVATPVARGGRTPVDAVEWVPWGTASGARSLEGGWPGRIPGPAPALVFDPPLPAQMLDADGGPVVVTARGIASGMPAVLGCARLWPAGRPVESWAGPWAHDVRWWDRHRNNRQVFWQLVVRDLEHHGEHDEAGVVACLVAVTRGRAGVAAVYD